MPRPFPADATKPCFLGRRLAWGSGGSGAGGRRAGGTCAGLLWNTRHGTGDILGLFQTKLSYLLEEVPLTSRVESRSEAFRQDGSSQ